MKKHLNVFIVFVMALVVFAPFQAALTVHATGTLYEVGPGKPYLNIGDVPWESLNAGDTVKIYWRSTSYKEKIVISRAGTITDPITVIGVPGPTGQLPVMDGNGATTRAALTFSNDDRGVIKIGSARFAGSTSDPANDIVPKNIVIQGLEIRGARGSYRYKDFQGRQHSYNANAAPVYIEYGTNITLRNDTFTDAGNGLFISSINGALTKNVLVEGNYIYDNGVANSDQMHNNYTSALGITFQYNHFGPLCSGCGGSNLKDRSSGTVIRYNWIEGGNRTLDLVDSSASSLYNDAAYNSTFVYGNVLIKDSTGGNDQIIHFGGDSGSILTYRKNLYLYNNTIISSRLQAVGIMLSADDEIADIRNNIMYKTVAGNAFYLSYKQGTINLSHNWMSSGWNSYFDPAHTGIINDDGTQINGTSPGFVNEGTQDYTLAAGSAAINAGTTQHAATSSNPVTLQYVKHQSFQVRPVNGVIDMGAFEF